MEDKRTILYYILLAVKETDFGNSIINVFCTSDMEMGIIDYKDGVRDMFDIHEMSGMELMTDVLDRIRKKGEKE